VIHRRRFDVNDGVRNLREGRLRAMRRPINPITFEAESVSEWNPSEVTLMAPVA
jgi:hypothetical protein